MPETSLIFCAGCLLVACISGILRRLEHKDFMEQLRDKDAALLDMAREVRLLDQGRTDPVAARIQSQGEARHRMQQTPADELLRETLRAKQAREDIVSKANTTGPSPHLFKRRLQPADSPHVPFGTPAEQQEAKE